VLRSDLSGSPSFRELLQRVRQVAIEAYANQDLPFEKLVETIRPERHSSRTPLFQVLFLLENTPTSDLTLTGLKLESVPIDLHVSTFDVALLLWEKEDELTGTLEYSTELFDAITITRLIEHFLTLLEAIGDNPDHDIKSLASFRVEDAQLLMDAFNEGLEDESSMVSSH
jgi:non-ribosomal peptide synthetase component F